MTIPIWQRFLVIFIYIIPLSDAIPFGRHLFEQFPVLQGIILLTIPILLLQQVIPFGSLLIFFMLFLAVVRNPKIPYFLQFNTLQALLLDICLILLSYGFRVILQPFGQGLLVRSLASTVLVAMVSIVIFVSFECFQGKEPDLPGLSEAVRIQL